MENYLKPTYFLDFNNDIIKQKVKELIDSDDLTENAIKLFYFVRDKIKYNPYSPCDKREYYRSSEVLKRGSGYCIQKAVLLCSMLRLAKIPCKLVFVDIKNYNAPEKLTKLFGNTYHFHGYCKLYLNNKWVSAAPTFNIEMCEKFGYKPTEFNGKEDALLEKYNVNGELTFEYINFRGEFDDLPFNIILNGFKEELGDVFSKWVKYVNELNFNK